MLCRGLARHVQKKLFVDNTEFILQHVLSHCADKRRKITKNNDKPHCQKSAGTEGKEEGWGRVRKGKRFFNQRRWRVG